MTRHHSSTSSRSSTTSPMQRPVSIWRRFICIMVTLTLQKSVFKEYSTTRAWLNVPRSTCCCQRSSNSRTSSSKQRHISSIITLLPSQMKKLTSKLLLWHKNLINHLLSSTLRRATSCANLLEPQCLWNSSIILESLRLFPERSSQTSAPSNQDRNSARQFEFSKRRNR